MSEPQGEYNIEQDAKDALEMLGAGYDNAAEIHPPKTIKVLRDGGLEEYRVWGWVKVSAKFINHVRELKGAKLAIWTVIALSIDEDSVCDLRIKDLEKLTGYSHTEVIDSLKELGEMGYLAARKNGTKNLYTPEFAARSTNLPTEKPNGKETLPKERYGGVYQERSSPPLEKTHPSIKELKELIPLSIENAIVTNQPVTEEMARKASIQNNAPRQFENALGFSKPLAWWSNKEWTAFAEWVCERYAEDKLCFANYNIWRNTPYTKGGMSNNRIRGFVKEFYDSWDMFMMANVKPAEENRPEYRRYVAPKQTEELIPNPKAKQR